MLKQAIASVLLSTLLLGGCSSYEGGFCVGDCGDTKPTVAEKKEHKELTPEEDIKNAQKAYKYSEVKKVMDYRDVTDHITVQLLLSEKEGYYYQASNAVPNTDKFLNTLHDKPKTATVMVLNNEGQKLVQFSVDTETGKHTLDFAQPALKKLLLETNYFASHK